MANLSNADSRRGLTVETPPNQNPKDIQGSDNPIPLSPQWLISKAVDNKELGPHQDERLDGVKTSAASDDLTNTGKKKYVFRPILHDSDSGRRDNWHDEERETNSAIRRDRWREGDKEPGDARRMERWSENTSKHFGDARRAPSERWNDSGNKESDQRRESKWNTRWGPGDKESDSRREKWLDSSKGGNGTSEKGAPVPYLISHGKDINNHGKETEDDLSSRSWRSNYLLGRGRGDSSHQFQMPVKQPNTFGYSRVRTENGISSVPTSRGRFNPIMSSTNSDAPRFQHLGLSHDKPDGTSGDLSTLRYTRMKLLDIYRTTDVQSLRLSIGDFIEVPSLTQVEPLEPLAFFAPTPDESVITKGIDKGEIVSSGAPQLSKESSVGKINPDTVLSRQSKLGSRHDLLTSGDGCKDDNIDNTKSENCGPLESPSYEKRYYQLGQFSKVDANLNSSLFQPNEANEKELESAAKMITKEATWLESSSRYVVPRRSQSAGDHIHGSAHDRKDFSLGVGPVELDMRSFHLQKDVESKNNVTVAPLFYRDGSQWQNTEGIGFHLDTKGDLYTKRQSTESVKEGDPFSSKDMLIARNLQPPSPEDLSLYYKDPQGQIQGPFSGGDLIGWFEAGYFGIDLQVRHASSPADAPFLPLGDVMPHLRMKAGPPPGFGVVKHSVSLDESHKGKIVSSNNIYAGLGETNIFKTGQRNMHDAATEAQNRFLESLMLGNMNGSPSDNFSVSAGIQESGGSSSSCLPSVVGENQNDKNYLLAQAKLLERQRLSLNPLSHWSGGDASSMASKTNMISDCSAAHAKLLPSAGDSSPQILQSPQHVDLLSLLHAGADKPPSQSANSAIIDETAEASDAQFSLENDDSVDPAIVTKPVMADSSIFSEAVGRSVSLTFSEAMEKPEEVIFDTQKISQSLGDVGAVHKPPLISQDQVLAQFGSDTTNDLQPVEDSQTSHHCVSSISDQLHDTNISSVDLTDRCHTELTFNKEEVAEAQEVKKASEKKSKKQKKSKTKIASDPGKIVSGQKSSTGIGIVGAVADVSKSEVRTHTDESLCGPSFGTGGEVSFASSTEPSESQGSHISSSVNLLTCESLSGGEAESGAVGTLTSNPKATLSQWAWKSTPGLKPKSLLEIQQEEQLRAQRETSHSEIVATATSARILSVPWAGLVTNLESKSSHDTIQAATSTLLVNSENTLKSKNSKSQLHDLLAEEVLAKSNKEDIKPFANNAQDSLLQSPSLTEAHVDTSTITDDDFVEAKDTRKARKKASKSKASGVKIPQSVVSSELSAAPSPIEKAKSTRQAQQDKDYLPVPPTGPSLGDFVLWKGDQATSVPPLAWSGDSRKPQRPMPLKDIQMEQEKRSGTLQQQVPIPTPVKQQPSHISRGSGTSRQLFGSSPSNTASSIQLISQVPAQKSRDEDDLFWGPLEQTKPNPKSSGSWGIKGTTSKGASGAGSGRKPSGSRPVDQSLSSFSSPSPSVSKGSRGVSVTKNSEAMEFRDWCVNEWIRLTGTNDTSFLEFCIKQSTSEAEMLLRENLGSMDPNHEFIDKFLNYKEFLPSDVLEIAFQLPKSHNPSTGGASHHNSNMTAATEADGAEEGLEGPSKGRGKKKGKKGQKVSASILGFNVVSNRIMMGEIQSIQD
ncbi:hypothetical protein C4D60_Mb04t35300 [Musa balbisiana]|uniref:GYF domain-containing protein n=1 Tax=Musa balbisiana TaxID=52838 RepID=A0A4S8KGX6_MUSBA|nr:hypothetical protein C4D60_Mb04t35300 [Musa balbisiana]